MSAFVKVVSYPSSSGKKRRRNIEILKFNTYANDYELNVESAIPWVLSIQEKTRPNLAPHLVGKQVQSRTPQEFLVLINPVGGKGKAKKIFKHYVAPVLTDANIVFKVELTKYANHAKEMIRSIDLTKYDGLIIVSGDGLVHEVVNGLMERTDRDEALRFPICHIPGGSGNALAASVCYHCKIPFKANNYAYDVAKMVPKPVYHPINLVHIETTQGHRAAFLSIEFGITADVTIDSEKWRKVLGPARLAAGALWKIVKKPRYRARISYLPYKEIRPISALNGVLVRANSLPAYSGSQFSLDASGIYTLDWMQSQQTLNSAIYSPTSYHISNLSLNRRSSLLMVTEPDPTMGLVWRSAHSVPLVPDLSKPVPPNWIKIEDNFCGVNLTMISHVASNMKFMPDAKLNDQCMYLTLMRSAKCTRGKLLTAFRDLNSGAHLDSEIVELIPLQAVRIEPLLEKNANLCVDGELIPCGPIQAVTTSYCATLIGC